MYVNTNTDKKEIQNKGTKLFSVMDGEWRKETNPAYC